jgi:hypothetical protein
LVLLGLAAGAIAAWRVPPAPPALFTLEPFTPSVSVDREWRALEAELARIDPAEGAAEVKQALEALGNAEVEAPRGAHTPAWRQAQTQLEQAASRYAAKHGGKAYMALGAHLWKELATSLFRALRAARRAGLSLDAAQRQGGPDWERVRALGGRFVEEGLRVGLVRADASTHEQADWVWPLVWEARWALFARERFTPDALQLASRRGALAAWKAESHPTLSWERRMELLAQAEEQLPEFSAARSRAALLLREERWEEALVELDRAGKDAPNDAEVQRALVSVRERASKHHEP